MEKQLIILVLVISLVLMTGVQAYQISDLKDNIGSGEAGYASGSSGYSSGGSAQQPATTMVGGC